MISRSACSAIGVAAAALAAVGLVSGAAGVDLGGASSPRSAGEAPPVVYRIHLDRDMTDTYPASRAIEAGLRVAFADFDGSDLIPGREVRIEFVAHDHRKNMYRSKRHMDAFIADPRGLAFVADAHSPQLIKYRDHLNANQALTLVPWAAGGPITRAATEENWIFRLSVDDQKAGAVIAADAVRNLGCRDYHLILIDNPWGRSNARTLSEGLARFGRRPSSIQWLPWRADIAYARRLFQTLRPDAEDCVLLVAGAESAAVALAMLDLPWDKRPRLLSHWGIAVSNFPYHVQHAQREAIGLRFVQSCHNLFDKDRPIVRRALERLADVGGGQYWAGEHIPAAAGFAHAHDLGRLLIAAMRQASLTGDVLEDRARIRAALERLETPVEGLIKTYWRPFAPYKPGRRDAHEALDLADLCMASFDSENVIRVDFTRPLEERRP